MSSAAVDMFPRPKAVNIMFSALLRGQRLQACEFTELLGFITFTFILVSLKCLHVQALGELYQVWERSECWRLLIRKWSHPAVTHGAAWLSYRPCFTAEPTIWRLKFIFPLLGLEPAPLGSQNRDRISFSRALTDPERQSNLDVWKARFHLLTFSQNLQTVSSVRGVRGAAARRVTADSALNSVHAISSLSVLSLWALR